MRRIMLGLLILTVLFVYNPSMAEEIKASENQSVDPNKMISDTTQKNLIEISPKVSTPQPSYPDLELQVSISPDKFQLYDPATLDIVFRNLGTTKISCAAILPGTLELSLIEGDPNNVNILIHKNPFGGLANTVLVRPGKDEQLQYPLYKTIQFRKGGRYAFAYKLNLWINSKSEYLHTGNFVTEVQDISDEQLNNRLTDVMQRLNDNNSKTQALQDLLGISSAKALPSLQEALIIFAESEERFSIIKAMFRTNSDESFGYLSKCFLSTSDERTQDAVMSGALPYAKQPDKMKAVESLWTTGLSSQHENTRTNCVYHLGYHIKPFPESKLRALITDESPKVRQAVQSVLLQHERQLSSTRPSSNQSSETTSSAVSKQNSERTSRDVNIAILIAATIVFIIVVFRRKNK